MNLMILAADSKSAIEAQQAGIERIFFDLEYIGKESRQHGRNTVKSHNNLDDLPSIRKVVSESTLLVRTNPIHAYSKIEIDKIIRYGADIVMLPMAMDHYDVQQFIEMVGGRAKVCIMIETAAAMARIDKILSVPGIDEIFIGLNDLHICLNLSFMFELLSGGIVEYLAEKCNKARIPFGFGGIARIGEGVLPSDCILGEHVRLGSQSVILSRTFKGIAGADNNTPINLKEEVTKVRNRINDIMQWREDDYEDNRNKIIVAVDNVVDKLVNRQI